MIWNEHAYAVTHVNEDGTIPQTSSWPNNWDDPTLNNYRQNVPGMPLGNALGDATAGASKSYSCAGTSATMWVAICNRGASALPPAIAVGFYDGGSSPVCSAHTSQALLPEQCEKVSCTWSNPPQSQSEAVDLTVIADDGAGVSEGKEGNNTGVVLGVYGQPPT